MTGDPASSARRGIPEPLSLAGLRTLSIHDRPHLVQRAAFASLVGPDASVQEFLASLPRLLAADELRVAARRTAASVRRGAPVFMALGGHVVKVGLAPVVIDLMQRGVLRAVVMNGATAIHDAEVALIGATSEDVGAGLRDGSFGMVRETPQLFERALARTVGDALGLGQALGQELLASGLPHTEVSILAQGARLGIPITVHVGIGTDTVHMHPEVDGARLGQASHHDFRLLASLACELDGGTWINVGSAVVLPEVFLKVVSLARNLGYSLAGVTAINFDMLQHYRTQRNVLQRPVERGISITGHHEINLPLFRLALLGELAGQQQEG